MIVCYATSSSSDRSQRLHISATAISVIQLLELLSADIRVLCSDYEWKAAKRDAYCVTYQIYIRLNERLGAIIFVKDAQKESQNLCQYHLCHKTITDFHYNETFFCVTKGYAVKSKDNACLRLWF